MTKQSITLLVLLAALAVSASGAELRVPAFTAYTLPDPDGARISQRGGVTRWNRPDLKVVWYGQFKQTGEITATVSLRLPKDDKSKLKLTVAGQSREVTVTGAGNDTLVSADFGTYMVKETGYQSFSLESLNAADQPAGDLDALLLAGPAARDAHFNLKERRNAASVHLAYPVPRGTNVQALYCEVTAVEDPLWTFYLSLIHI